MKTRPKKQRTKSVRNEEKPSSGYNPVKSTRRSRSSLTDRYPRVFVDSVREPSLPLLDEKESMEDDRDTEMKKESDSEFDFLPVAGQMKLTEIQKSQIKRMYDKAMEELRSVLERVRLAIDEYHTADKELKTYESPDSEFEAEEEKRKIRERIMRKKMKRKERRAKRKMDRPEEEENKEEGKEEWNGHDVQSKTADQTTTSGIEDTEKGGEEGTSPDSSGSSSEEHEDDDDENADERKTTQETWTMPGQVQRTISKKTLFKRSKRRRVLKQITSYLELCVDREDILRQVQLWIESIVDEELMKPAREVLFSPELLLDDLPLKLRSDIENLGAALLRLKNIADSLGIGVSKIEDENEESSADKPMTKARRPTKRDRLYNVDELDNEEIWAQAENDVEKIINQAIKTVPVRTIRLNLENAKKQILLMSQLMARRNLTIRQLDEKAINLEGDLTKATRHSMELRKTNKKAQVKLDRLQHQNEDLQNNVKEQQKVIAELNETLDNYKKKESFGLYQSSSESMGSSRDSSESMSVVSLVEKPVKHLGPTGEKVLIKTPKSSTAHIAVPGESQSDSTAVQGSKTSDKGSKTSDEGSKTSDEGSKISDKGSKTSNEGSKTSDEGSKISDKGSKTSNEGFKTSDEGSKELREDLERVQEELKIEKEKCAAFEQEFMTLQTDKVKAEQERSNLEIQLEDVKRENERAMEGLTQKLEDMERENKRMTGELECNEEMIKYQEEKIGQLVEEITCLEERMMSFPSTPATMSVASMAGGPRRERRKTSLQLGLEPQTARQMVAKVTQQYEAELVSLKDHMSKELQRHQAELRRQEQDHKKDVQNIHKESLLLLRALNRFKDCAANLLERENLSQEAHAIRSHAPLPLDENFGDTRQMLARMAILSNEMLTSVELHLSKGLMSKRLELKDYPGDTLRRSKDYGSKQAGKLRGASNKLEIRGQQLELQVWRLLQEGRREEVMECFKELQSEISSHETEVAKVATANEEKVKKKDAQLKRVLRRELDVKKTVDEQKCIIKNLASIWKSRRIGQKYICRNDQQRNLKLLEEAMKENEISKELYQSTAKLVKEAMDFPRKRLVEMVKKYVHFRRVKDIQETVRRLKMDRNVNERALLSLKDIEDRMIQQKETWRQKKEQFINARANVLEKLHQVVTQIHEETGILLIKPMDLIPRLEDIKEDVKVINEEDILEAVNIPKERAKRRKTELMAQAAAAKEPFLSIVEGTRVPYGRDQSSSWKVSWEKCVSLGGDIMRIPGGTLVITRMNVVSFMTRNLLVRASQGFGATRRHDQSFQENKGYFCDYFYEPNQ